MFAESNRSNEMFLSYKDTKNTSDARGFNPLMSRSPGAGPYESGCKESTNYRSPNRKPWVKDIVKKQLEQICKEKTTTKNELLVCPFCFIKFESDEERNKHAAACVRIYSKMTKTYNCKFFQCQAKFISVENRDKHHKSHLLGMKEECEGVLDDSRYENIQPRVNEVGVLEIKPMPITSRTVEKTIFDQEYPNLKTIASNEASKYSSGKIVSEKYQDSVVDNSVIDSSVLYQESFQELTVEGQCEPCYLGISSAFNRAVYEARTHRNSHNPGIVHKVYRQDSPRKSNYMYYKSNGFTLMSCSVVLHRLKLTPGQEKQGRKRRKKPQRQNDIYHDLRWMSSQSKHSAVTGTLQRQSSEGVGTDDQSIDLSRPQENETCSDSETLENYLLQ